MGSVLCPDDGPPRIVRFGHLPVPDMVAVFDRESNVLIVDQDYYDALSDWNRDIVLKTTSPALFVETTELGVRIIRGEFPPVVELGERLQAAE